MIDHHGHFNVVGQRVVASPRLSIYESDEIDLVEAQRPGRQDRQPQLLDHGTILRPPHKAAESDLRFDAIEFFHQREQTEGTG